VGARRRQRDRPGGQTGGPGIVAPPAELAADQVDVQVEGERVPVDAHSGQGGLAGRRRTVQQDQYGHGVS
jgi:hypothetical protein